MNITGLLTKRKTKLSCTGRNNFALLNNPDVKENDFEWMCETKKNICEISFFFGG